MGRKGESQIPNNDAYQRLNFLYQASHLMLGLHLESKSNAANTMEATEEVGGMQPEMGYLILSQKYNKTMQEISRKAVIRL